MMRYLRLRRQKRKRQSGQTMVEYMLIMLVVVGALIGILSRLKKSQFFYKNFTEPLVKYVRYNYKYGDPKAQGWDEGSPSRHIQISKPNDGQTFRLFQPVKR